MLTIERLGEDARIAVPQHDNRALDDPFGARVSLLVKLEASLQRLVGNFLHPKIHRRVNLDTSLQKIVNSEVATAFELLKDSSKDCGRGHLVLAPRARANRALLGCTHCVPRNKTVL